MRLKILLTILGLLILGSGFYLAANTIFKPKPPKPPESVGFENLKDESTKSAEVKEKKPKKEESEAVKGTTQYITPTNYQPTPESKTLTKKLTQATKTIKEPDETPPQLPEITEPSPTEDDPFSEQHLIGFWTLYSEIETVGDQMIAIRNQIYDLEEEYYRVPAEERRAGVALSVVEGRIRVRQERIYNEIQLLVINYNRLHDRQAQLFANLCSTYYDVIVYYNLRSICL